MDKQSYRSGNFETYVEFINNVLMNRDIDCDEMWWEKKESKDALLCLGSDTYSISNSEKMGINSDEPLVILDFNRAEKLNDFFEKLKTETVSVVKAYYERNSKNQFTAVNILTFVKSVRDKVILNNSIRPVQGNADSFESKTKKELSSYGYRQIKLNYIFILLNNSTVKELKIENVDRFDMIQMPARNNNINWERACVECSEIQGYAFTTDLYQLVKLYNEIGDALFKNNVRFGINEQFGVDKAIRETLETAPENFWFRNNGITIVVDKDDFKLNRVGEVLLDCKSDLRKYSFSVVNGAQTITAAAEYFFLRDMNKRDDQKENNSEKDPFKAKVLVRIIHVKNNAKSNEVKQISIALNRQKPIKVEDIAYTSPYIEKMMAYVERKGEMLRGGFKLIKRGEELANSRNCIDLAEFARAQKACSGKPGEARSRGLSQLLNFTNKKGNASHFGDEDIFPPKWDETADDDEDQVFQKYYGATLFAHNLAKEYESKDYPKDSLVKKNGKWYFVSTMIWILNNEVFKDYSDFNHRIEDYKGNLGAVIDCFSKGVEEIIVKMGFDSNSNTFKNDELFRKIIEDINSKDLLMKMRALLPTTKDENPSYNEGISLERSRKEKTRVDKVIINSADMEINVNSQAGAMLKTIEYLLNVHPESIDEVIREIPELSYEDLAATNSTFRDGHFVEVNTKRIYVGTSLNFENKMKVVNNVARVLRLKRSDIEWYYNSQSVFRNVE